MHLLLQFPFLAALGTTGVAFYALLSDYVGRLNEAYLGTLRDLGAAASQYESLAGHELVHRLGFGDRSSLVLGPQGYLILVRTAGARFSLRPRSLDRPWPASIRYGAILPLWAPVGPARDALAQEIQRLYEVKDPDELKEREKEFLCLSFLKAAHQCLGLLSRSRWVRRAIAAAVMATILGSAGALATIPFSGHGT